MTHRIDGRSADTLRPIHIETGVMRHPQGSVMYTCGHTKVLISASLTEGVPSWMRGEGRGWLTAEYAMHPAAGLHRQRREGRKGSIGGRTAEIQRLIGRSLRAAVDLDRLGERTLAIDCDVIDADGGTRTASIAGGFVATVLALSHGKARGLIPSQVVRAQVGAISVGLVESRPLLDLCYEEDRVAEVDLNVVATPQNGVVEVQGTAEGAPVPRPQIDALLDLGLGAMVDIGKAQRAALESAGADFTLFADAIRV